MKVDLYKVNLIIAEQCKTMSSLRDVVSPQTLCKVKKGRELRTDTVGRIAKALGVPVTDILEQQEDT